MPLSNDVIVLSWNTPASQESNARKIAAFLGARATVVPLATVAGDGLQSIRKLLPPSCACVISNVETLAQMVDATETGMDSLRVLMDHAEHAFIYGFLGSDRHSRILRTLSSGGLLRVQGLERSDARFRVANGHRDWCGPFSGLSLGAPDPGRDASFVEGAALAPQTVLIRAGNKPFFVRADYGKSNLCLSACPEFADLDENISGEERLLPWFSRVVPLTMFLRRALGKRLWHNDHPRACFIIDDPLLKSRYGFLEYRRLLDAVRRKRFSICIAFIPWNYRRSRKEIAELLAANPGVSSLCVHGCDHTRAEFGAIAFESLCAKAQLALDRMHAHHRRWGVPFDDVMVFPQGIFSSEALRALKVCGYLAAVNSDLCPSNLPRELTLRDLLEVAITRFGDFPLFGRRYPKDPAEFAFDLFLGKPVLAVEHHAYFRNGYEALETFVEQLHALEAQLEWADLRTICSSACLTRIEEGDVLVRFYSDRFRLTNHRRQLQRYRLFRPRAFDGQSPSLTVNSSRWPCRQQDDTLEIVVSLDAGETADIKIASATPDPVALSPKPRAVHGARVLVRRLISEFRDNYVDTHPVMTGIVSGARKLHSRRRGQDA